MLCWNFLIFTFHHNSLCSPQSSLQNRSSSSEIAPFTMFKVRCVVVVTSLITFIACSAMLCYFVWTSICKSPVFSFLALQCLPTSFSSSFASRNGDSFARSVDLLSACIISTFGNWGPGFRPAKWKLILSFFWVGWIHERMYVIQRSQVSLTTKTNQLNAWSTR